MPASVSKPPRVVAFDSDRLGSLVGAVAALGVAVVQMFAQNAGIMATIEHAGWAYVGAYAATFILVRLFLRASLFQMLDEKRSRREDRRRKMREQRERDDEEPGGIAAEAAAGPAGDETVLPSESGLPRL